MRFKFDDAVIWFLLLSALGIVLWMLHGSPTLEGGVMTFGTVFASSLALLWRKFVALDKKAAVSFTKFRAHLQGIEQRLERMETKIDALFLPGKK